MKMYKWKPLTAFFPSGIAHHSSKIELDATFLVPDELCFYLRQHVIYRVALNFCGSLILRMSGFLRFAETYFCDWNKFFRLSESRLLFGIITFSYYEYKQSIANAGEHGLLGEQYAEV